MTPTRVIELARVVKSRSLTNNELDEIVKGLNGMSLYDAVAAVATLVKGHPTPALYALAEHLNRTGVMTKFSYPKLSTKKEQDEFTANVHASPYCANS